MRYAVVVSSFSGAPAFTVGPFYSPEYAEATAAKLAAQGHTATVVTHFKYAEEVTVAGAIEPVAA